MKRGHLVSINNLFLLAVLGLLSVALTGHPGVTGPVPAWTYLAGSILCVLAAAALLWKGSRSHVYSAVALLCGFVLWNGFCGQSSLDPYLSRLSVCGWMAFAAAALGAWLGIRSRQDWVRLARGMVAISAIASAYGLSVGAPGAPLQGNWTNPDCFSFVPLIGFFLATGLAVEAGPRARIGWSTLALFLLMAVVLTGARAAASGLLLGFPFTLLLLYARIKKSGQALAVASFPLLLSLLGLLALAGANNSLDKWERLLTGKDPVGVQSRLDVFTHGWKAVGEHPLTGSGPGTFHLAYQKYRPEQKLASYSDYMNVAHDDYMQVAVESGIPGLLMWLALLAGALRVAWKGNLYPPGWCAGALGGLVAVGVYMISNFAVPVPADLVWLGALLGLAYALPLHASGREVLAPPNFVRILTLLLLVGGLACCVGAVQVARQERARQQAREAGERLDWETAYALLEDASGLVPANAQLWMEQAEICNRAYPFFGTRVWLERWSEALRRAREASPRNVEPLLAQAHFLEFVGDAKGARKLLELARQQVPYHFALLRALARNEILQGQYETAIQQLRAMRFSKNARDELVQAELVLLIEKQLPGRGVEMLKRWTEGTPDDLDVAFRAAKLARERGERTVAEDVLTALVRVAPARADYLLELASVHGELGLVGQQLTELDRLRQLDVEGPDRQVVRVAWQQWAQLMQKQQNGPVLEQQLQTFLLRSPQENWARSLLSQVYDARGARAEAREVLRDGVTYDADGRLRLQLADLCMKHGHPEVARGYYEELVAMSNSNPGLRQRLKMAIRAANEAERSASPFSAADPTQADVRRR